MKKSDAAKPVNVDFSGIRHFVLRANGSGAGQGPQARIFADWVEARLARDK